MGYIEKHLITGETVLRKTRLHWIAVLGPMLAGAFLAIIAVFLFYQASSSNQTAGADARTWAVGGVVLLVLAAVTIGTALLRRNSTEMAVTNRRILIKTGFFSRRTIELLLSRVESIVIVEPFLGRVLGYGTVVIRGTGGTPEPFAMIAQPTEFRRVVQEQIEEGQAGTRTPASMQRGPIG